MGQSIYRSTLSAVDLIDDATVSCTAGKWEYMGAYIVQAGEQISLGFGPQASQDSAVGRLFAKFMDSASESAEVAGKIRLSVWSPQNIPIGVFDEFDTDAINDNPSDRSKQMPFPDHIQDIQRDFKLVLEFKANATKTVSKANTSILMDVTRTLSW